MFSLFTNNFFFLFFAQTDSLSIDYQFTFNLSKVDDKHLTAISFKNQPTKSDVDVDFSVKCVNKGGQATNAKVSNLVQSIKTYNNYKKI